MRDVEEGEYGAARTLRDRLAARRDARALNEKWAVQQNRKLLAAGDGGQSGFRKWWRHYVDDDGRLVLVNCDPAGAPNPLSVEHDRIVDAAGDIWSIRHRCHGNGHVTRYRHYIGSRRP